LALFKSGTNGPEEIGSTEIYLGNENVNGVVLTPATVSMRVIQEGSRRPLTVGSVSLGPNEENGSVGRGVYQVEPQNGIYIFHGLLPGKYQINFTNHGSPISNL